MKPLRALLACFSLLSVSLEAPASATMTDEEIADAWYYFIGDVTFGDAPEWSLLGTNYQLGIGTIEKLYWTLAWRNDVDGVAGAFLRYVYASPVSPSELPGEGPMNSEEVEATFDCAARTVRIHNMYLYREDGSYIGKWFDPEANVTPVSFETNSLFALVYAKVC